MQTSKSILLTNLNSSFEVLYKTAILVPENKFNTWVDNKWTPAENISHLITATKMTLLPFTLPKFIPALLYGKSSGQSRTYDNLVATYEGKLKAGAKATGIYVPKKTNYDQGKLSAQILKESEKLVAAIDTK